MADTVDSRIQDLPAIDSLADGDLLVVAREGDNFYARKMTVAQLTGYIEEVAGPYLDGAQEAATQAVTAVGQIGTAVEDTQAAQDAAETAAAQAEAARDHYPIPEDGTWHVYNPKSGQYEDTGEPSTGTPGEQGTPGAKGEPGTSVQDIRQVSGTHAPGTTDTYEVVLTDGSTRGQFQVYNGADGDGVGDMLKAVYDPHGKNTDVFAYVDQAVENISAPDVPDQIAQHNADEAAHPDIRALIDAKETEGAEALENHVNNKDNPHAVTAAQVGADPAGSAAQALFDAKSYVDAAIGNALEASY